MWEAEAAFALHNSRNMVTRSFITTGLSGIVSKPISLFLVVVLFYICSFKHSLIINRDNIAIENTKT